MASLLVLIQIIRVVHPHQPAKTPAHVFPLLLIHLLAPAFVPKVTQVVFVKQRSKRIHVLVILVKHVAIVHYHHRTKLIYVFAKRVLLVNNVNGVIHVSHHHV